MIEQYLIGISIIHEFIGKKRKKRKKISKLRTIFIPINWSIMSCLYFTIYFSATVSKILMTPFVTGRKTSQSFASIYLRMFTVKYEQSDLDNVGKHAIKLLNSRSIKKEITRFVITTVVLMEFCKIFKLKFNFTNIFWCFLVHHPSHHL